MTVPCQPMPQPLANEMLQIVARAMCDRPGDSSAQRDSRTLQMVLSVLGFAPRDGLEYMLSSIAVGHFHLILDSMHDVFHGQDDKLKAKTKTTIVAINRAMLETVRECRLERRRPVDRSAEVSRQDEAEVRVADAPDEVSVMAAGPAEERWADADAVESVPASDSTDQAEGVTTEGVDDCEADSETAQVVQVQACAQGYAQGDDVAADTAWADGQSSAVAMGDTPPPGAARDATGEPHLAAMAAALELLKQAAASGSVTAGAPSGD